VPSDDLTEPLARACETIEAAAGGALVWEWDPRFACGLTAFTIDLYPEVLAAIGEVFGREWTSAEMNAGPPAMVRLSASLGTLRGGQRLWTTPVDRGTRGLFCAWWPWGSGQRISVRIGGVADDPTVAAGLEAALRARFAR
jgi:hypothetical protein